MSVIDRLRQPEYTGENRCIPCTAVNIAIATGASVLTAFRSTVLGGAVFALALTTIYLRGYLVPGTPTFTKRYFPEHLLRWFDKEFPTQMTNETNDINPERILLNAGTVKSCRGGTDLCLTTEFQETWRDRIHTVRAHDLDEEHLADTLDIQSNDVRITVDQHGDAFVASTDDTVIGQWSSEAALIADTAAATELNKRSSQWSGLTPSERAHVLMNLRIFVEDCPKCDGAVQIEQEVAESCCRSYDVVVSACQDCDARLFEIEWDTPEDNNTAQPSQPVQANV